jgi:hypothetical protein
MKKLVCLFFLSLTLFSQGFIAHDSLLTDKPLKDPSKAIYLSLALPGAGQVYNESYWKTALVLPTFAYFLFTAIDEDDKMWAARSQIATVKNDLAPLSALENPSDAQSAEIASLNTELDKLRSRSRSAKENRSVAIWRTGLVYLINVLDAYIGAYLFGFDELIAEPKGEAQSFQFNTVAEPKALSFQFQYNF